MISRRRVLFLLGIFVLLLTWGVPARAHHVLGRPAYIWNEDSRTPPGMSVENQIGHYMVNLMVYPAFPKAGEESRIKLYATHLDTHASLEVPVHFFIRDDRWWGDKRAEELGVQTPVDAIYRQIVVFNEEADYLLTVSFNAENEPYEVDVPITIGEPTNLGAPLLAAGVIAGVLGLAAFKKRRRRLRRPTA